jgi:hypothetical protein
MYMSRWRFSPCTYAFKISSDFNSQPCVIDMDTTSLVDDLRASTALLTVKTWPVRLTRGGHSLLLNVGVGINRLPVNRSARKPDRLTDRFNRLTDSLTG